MPAKKPVGMRYLRPRRGLGRGGRLIVVLLVLIAAAVALTRPPVREAISNMWQAAKEDIGPREGSTTMRGHERVYIVRGTDHYHRYGCVRLEGVAAVAMDLPTARALYKPCPDCMDAE